MEQKKIIVTGGSGFIGQQLLQAGMKTNDACYLGGHRIVNIDKFKPKIRYGVVPTFEADLTDPESTSKVFNEAVNWLGGVDYVFNMVAKVSYTLPFRKLEEINVKTAFNITHECAKYKAFLIHMSGTAVHGHVDRAIKETDPLNYVEAYGKSKAIAEEEIFRISKEKNLRSLIFRSTAPIGPGLETAGINELYKMITDQPLVLATKGSRVTYVSTEDIGRTFVFAAENQDRIWKNPEKLSDIVYNLGVEESFTDKQVGEHLVKIILGEGKKKVRELPIWIVQLGSYPIEWSNALANIVRKEREEPNMSISLAKLIKGPHFQDPTKFKQNFEGFHFKHPTPEDVLNTGVIHKYQTEWKERKKTKFVEDLLK